MSSKEMMASVGSKMYPSLYVSESEIPEIDSWEVGKEYTLNIKVKMTSKDEYADGRETSSRLEVIAYEDTTPKEDNDPSTPRMSTEGGYMIKK